MENIIWNCKDYSIVRVGVERLYDIASFIVNENYSHHSLENSSNDMAGMIEDIYQDELLFASDSFYYIVVDCDDRLIGCIRAFKWDCHTLIPMEKIFNISPIEKLNHTSSTSFWHIGRFAIDSKVGFSTLKLFKQLMLLAITPIINETDSYMLAETDAHLLRVMNALGIETMQLGNSIMYLASETIPICSNHNGLLHFYQHSRHLLSA